jgi:hypothetical protein
MIPIFLQKMAGGTAEPEPTRTGDPPGGGETWTIETP